MSTDAQKTLFHPFDNGDLDLPAAGERALLIGAEPGLRLPQGFAAELTIAQGFKPWFDALKASGRNVSPVVDGDGYGLCLVLAGRHRAANADHLAEAVERARPGGLVLVAGAKESGIQPLRKFVGARVALDGSLSKYHGVAFWLRRPEDPNALIDALRGDAQAGLVDGRFRTAPGSFSQDRIDAGSRLLAESLPAGLKGKVADFCAGWAYLSVELAARAPAVTGIDLYEADHASLEAARDNMARLAPAMPARFFWHDLAAVPVEGRYDAIVMNPPFHQGRAAEPDIGRKMIAAASAALKPGGMLYLVANVSLPYDEALAKGFREVTELTRVGGFRVSSARR